MVAMEERILEFLRERGAVKGSEIYNRFGISTFELWRTLHTSSKIYRKSAAKRYLRLDRKVPGYARQSPAPEREFLTYTAYGLDEEPVEEKAREIKEEIEQISEYKLSLARKIAEEVYERAGVEECVFVIGGDVPLRMAHAEPRPERSTGKLVAGSDLDVVVVVLEEEHIPKLDSLLFEAKYKLLARPQRKEELDYIVKPIQKVEEQLNFETFEDRVACKIFYEAEYLAGERSIFEDILREMKSRGIFNEIRRLEEMGARYREESEKLLLSLSKPSREILEKTFTTTLEFSEIF